MTSFEYGATDALEVLGTDIRQSLRRFFGAEDGDDAIMAMAEFGLADKEPESRVSYACQTSYESIGHPGLSLSKTCLFICCT